MQVGCFVSFGVVVDNGVKDFIFKYFLYFFYYNIGQVQMGVVYGQQNVFNLQIGVDFFLYQVNGFLEFRQVFQCKKFVLYWYENGVSSCQGIYGDEAQGWQVIDEDVVVVVLYLIYYVLYQEFLFYLVDQFDFGFDQVNGGRDDMQVGGIGFVDGFFCFQFVYEVIVDCCFNIFWYYIYVGGGVVLWVCINEQDFFFQDGQVGGQVDGGGGFVYVIFLVGYSYDFFYNLNLC